MFGEKKKKKMPHQSVSVCSLNTYLVPSFFSVSSKSIYPQQRAPKIANFLKQHDIR